LSSGDRAFLDVDTADVPVLGRIAVDNAQNTDVEIARVGESVCRLVISDADEGVSVC